MITVLVKEIRFCHSGQSLWVVADNGKVFLHVKSIAGVSITETKCINTVCHADMQTDQVISIHSTPSGSTATAPVQIGPVVRIPAAAIEFSPTGNTIWVQSPIGATILRIKSRHPLLITDPTMQEFPEYDGRFYCEFEMEDAIEMCLVENISKKFNLL